MDDRDRFLAEHPEVGAEALGEQGEGGLLVELDDALAHVDGQIADALEVDDDLERRGEEAKVSGHGLAGGEDPHAQLVDLALEPVDPAVGTHGLLGEPGVARAQGLEALADHLLDQAAHEEKLVAEAAELLLVGLARMRERHQPYLSVSWTTATTASTPKPIVMGWYCLRVSAVCRARGAPVWGPAVRPAGGGAPP